MTAQPEPQWISACGYANDCVEVARLDDGRVLVRNSADPGVHLTFDAVEWNAFLDGPDQRLRAGQRRRGAAVTPEGGTAISPQRLADIDDICYVRDCKVEDHRAIHDLRAEVARLNGRIQDDAEGRAIVADRYRANLAEVNRLRVQLETLARERGERWANAEISREQRDALAAILAHARSLASTASRYADWHDLAAYLRDAAAETAAPTDNEGI